MFEIDENVPMPRRGIISQLPLEEMKVDDSFAVPAQHATAVKGILSRAGSEFDPKRRFVYRTEGEGIRVWRTA